MAARSEGLYTASEYANLPEIEGLKDELIEGERVLAAYPKTSHAVVLENLERLLEGQFPDHRLVREQGLYIQSPDGKESVPGPDLMALSAEDYERSILCGNWFEGTPLFIVEVISSSERRYRRMQKVGLYLEAGAKTVVEIVLASRVLLVYRIDEEAPETIRSGRIRFPFEADLAEIFARIP